MTPVWLSVLLTVLGFGGGYASALVARQANAVDRETARRAETRERVFQALKLIMGDSLDEQESGIAVLRTTYESDKLDPDDVAFVRTQLELFAAGRPQLDRPQDVGDTGDESGREQA